MHPRASTPANALCCVLDLGGIRAAPLPFAQLWVHDGERMVLASVSVAPGLYKIFDEILVNAADNKARDPRMDTLRVDIHPVRLPGPASLWKTAASVHSSASYLGNHGMLRLEICSAA